MTGSTHQVGRQKILIRYGGVQESLIVRSVFSELCRKELPLLLERILDEIDHPGIVVRIPHLDLNLTIDEAGLSLVNLEKEILKKVEHSLREKLQESQKIQVSITEDLMVTWRFYLEQGYLPQSSFYQYQNELQEALKSIFNSSKTSLDLSGILEVLGDEHALIRFEKMMTWDMTKSFFSVSEIFTPTDWKVWEQSIGVAEKFFGRREVFERTFKFALVRFTKKESSSTFESEKTKDFIQTFRQELQKNGIGISEKALKELPNIEERNVLLRLFPEYKTTSPQVGFSEREQVKDLNRGPKPVQAQKQEHKNGYEEQTELSPENEENEIRINIQNAGLVILAPFLPQLFSNMELDIAEREADISKAIAALHFLSFGKADFDEAEVVLEKILLGLPLSKGIENIEVLSTQEKEQCEALLKSVIEHWSILKNTSIDGLRNSFLKREGLLSKRNESWKLNIQRESLDILIDRLPWSISMIKTPWMKKLLTTTW